MKTLYKIIFVLFAGGYFYLSLIQLSDQNINYVEELMNKTRGSLVINFNEIDCSNPHLVLGKKVVMDSTLLGIYNKEGSYYVKTEVANNCGKKVFAFLKCSTDDIQKMNTRNINRGYLTAYINKIESSNPIAIADSIDKNNILLKGEEILILSGAFLDFSEMNIFKDAI